MRILHVYKDYFPVLGGIENHIKLLAEAQAAEGHDVRVLVTSRDRRTRWETINGVRVILAARLATISSAPLSIQLPRLLAAERPDVLHLHFPYPLGEIANYLGGSARATVLTYHSDIVRQKYLRVAYAPILGRVLSKANTIIATSPNYVESSAVLSRWRDKCLVVPLGIDPTPFLTAGLSGQLGLNRKIIGAEGSAKLLFVGRLRYYKGLDYLLAAMTELPNARLTIVGTGPMEQAWRSLARKLGVAGRVDFVGEVSPEELPGCYAACDLFVLPASERSEAFGAVQLEAMAAGRPVVSTEVGTGVSWVNQDQVTGLIVPPRNASALAAAITRLQADSDLRERMGSAGRARVIKYFTVQQMVQGVMKAYGRALGWYP